VIDPIGCLTIKLGFACSMGTSLRKGLVVNGSSGCGGVYKTGLRL
jgi:hypothetical protein